MLWLSNSFPILIEWRNSNENCENRNKSINGWMFMTWWKINKIVFIVYILWSFCVCFFCMKIHPTNKNRKIFLVMKFDLKKRWLYSKIHENKKKSFYLYNVICYLNRDLIRFRFELIWIESDYNENSMNGILVRIRFNFIHEPHK